jgi:hypothetical protein
MAWMSSCLCTYELADQPKCNDFFALFTRLDSGLPVMSLAQLVSASEGGNNNDAHSMKEITGYRVLFP